MADLIATRAAARRPFWIPLLLAAILFVAGYLRTTGINWDSGRHLHPDERFLCMVENALEPVRSLRAYLDTEHSTLNPNNRGFGFYVYGHFPLIAVHYIGRWFDAPGNDLDQRLFGTELGYQYDRVYLIGRGVSAACDVLVTLIVFFIGANVYGRAIGVLAALLYALAVLPIQQAHFFTVDAMANLFVVVALWMAVRAARQARWWDDVLFAIALGAGLACKVSIFLVGVPLVLAVVVRHGSQRAAQGVGQIKNDVERTRAEAALVVRSAISLTLVLLVSLLTFRLLQPYAFVPPFAARDAVVRAAGGGTLVAASLDIFAPRINQRWLDQMKQAGAQQSGNDDSPPNHQWATRASLGFPWHNLVAFGLGWPLGIVAWLGWLGALIEGLRGRAESWRHVLPAAWVALYFAWFGSGWVMSMRYLLPLYPVLVLTAAWLLMRIAAPQLDASLPDAPPAHRLVRVLGIVLIATTVVATAVWTLAFRGIYTRPHTRIAASRWMLENLPADVTLTIESSPTSYTQQVGLPDGSLPGAPAEQPGQPTGTISVTTPGTALTQKFVLPRAGQLTTVRINDVRAVGSEPTQGRFMVEVGGEDEADVIATCIVAGPFPVDAPFTSNPRLCTMSPNTLEANRPYVLRLRSGVPLLFSGAAVADEGAWDDGLPIPLPDFEPVSGRYRAYSLHVVYEDDSTKRERMQWILDRSQYLTISSNRFYASLTRNPRRWPMTIDYYRALFSGRLGFDLAEDFNATPTFGPFRFDDQPAEEAFTVYDHPRVFIFRKRDDYDPRVTAGVLEAADLSTVRKVRAAQITDRPVRLPLPPG